MFASRSGRRLTLLLLQPPSCFLSFNPLLNVSQQRLLQELKRPGLPVQPTKQVPAHKAAESCVLCRVVQSVGTRQTILHVKGSTPKEFSLNQHFLSVSPGNVELGKSNKQYAEDISVVQFWSRRFQAAIQSTFLPAGYPDSVGENYLLFAAWQFVTNVAVTANTVLASTFLLYSVGLGAGAIPTAGALNWVLKDGIGQLGTLLFGKVIAHNFDIHSKTWFFLSCTMLNLATGVEISTLVLPNYFLTLGSVANTLKGLAWMASGSTRSVFHLCFVRDNNIADITAKGTSQYICASLIGTAMGVAICSYIGQQWQLAMLAYAVLAATIQWSGYRTVQSIPLPTLNSSRLQLLAEAFLSSVLRVTHSPHNPFLNLAHEYESLDDESKEAVKMPSPLEVAAMDPPLPWLTGDPRLLNPAIRVGSAIERIIDAKQPEALVVAVTTFKFEHYLLVPANTAIHLVLHQEADAWDIIQAYLQAGIIRKRMQAGMSIGPHNITELRITLQETLLNAEKLTMPFMNALTEAGWNLEKVVVEAQRRRAIW